MDILESMGILETFMFSILPVSHRPTRMARFTICIARKHTTMDDPSIEQEARYLKEETRAIELNPQSARTIPTR